MKIENSRIITIGSLCLAIIWSLWFFTNFPINTVVTTTSITTNSDVYSIDEWQQKQGNYPSGSFEVANTGSEEHIKDIRFFMITDVSKENNDCLVGFWKNDPRPIGFSCNDYNNHK